MTRRDFVGEVKSGDRKRALVALRDELAEAIEACTDASDLSSLALRLTRVLEQIDQLGGDDAKDEDDLAARRKAKLSAATGS